MALVTRSIARCLCESFVLGLFVIGPSAPTQASFYLYPPGTGQVIVATTFTQASRGFDASGKFIPYDRFRKLDVNAYLEVGLTDALTAVVKPNLTQAAVSSPGDVAAAAIGAGSQAGARLGVWKLGALALAVEASVVFPDLGIVRNDRTVDGERGGTDIRALLGYTFSVGSWPTFVDAEFAYRWHAGSAPDELHGDLTIGTRPRPELLLLAQSFNVLAVGRSAPPFSRFRQHKLQISTVYDISYPWSLQVGALLTPAGANAPAEYGAIAAIWRRF